MRNAFKPTYYYDTQGEDIRGSLQLEVTAYDYCRAYECIQSQFRLSHFRIPKSNPLALHCTTLVYVVTTLRRGSVLRAPLGAQTLLKKFPLGANRSQT